MTSQLSPEQRPAVEWLERHLARRLRHDIKASYFPAIKDRKAGYKPVHSPLVTGDLETHVSGKRPLGCYVMDPAADGTVMTAVVDLDDKKRLLSWEALCAEGTAIAAQLESRGLVPTPVRSGSGHGLHLWLLWREAQPAGLVRGELKGAVERAGVSCDIDIFPAQDTLSGGMGNLVALPFSRESRPVRLSDGLVYEDLTSWPGWAVEPALSRDLRAAVSGEGGAKPLRAKPKLTVVSAAVPAAGPVGADELAGDAGRGLGTDDDERLPLSVELLRAAVGALPGGMHYDDWVRIGIALKVSTVRDDIDEDVAFGLWDEFSRRSEEKYDELVTLRRWQSFRPREAGGVTVGTIFHTAQEAGWVMPKGGIVPPRPVEFTVTSGVAPGPTIEVSAGSVIVRELEPDSLSSFVEIDRSQDPLLKKEMAWLRGGGGSDIDDMNRDHFIARDAGRVHLFVEEDDPELQRKILTKMSVQDFRVMYQNQQIPAGQTSAGRTTFKALGDFWLDSPFRRQYRQIVLEPGRRGCKPWQYNLWQGWSVEPSTAGSWALLDAHIRDNICRGDEVAYDYMLNWLAFTFQNPNKPIGTAVVLRGDKGTGKSLFVRAFGELFAKHFTQVTNAKAITGNFNSHLRSCIMLFADEAVWAGSRTEESTLKAYITEPYLQIEGKGQNAVTCRNMLHVIIATNHMWSAPASVDERRFFCLNVSNAQQQNVSYFKAIIRQLGTGGSARLLYDMLGRDISTFDPLRVPSTDELTEQKLLSMDAHGKWWRHRLEEGALHAGAERWEAETPAALIYRDYVDFCRDMGERNFLGAPEVLSRLLEMYIGAKIQKGRRRLAIPDDLKRLHTTWTFPALHDCRNHFTTLIKGKIAWNVWRDDHPDLAADQRVSEDDTLNF